MRFYHEIPVKGKKFQMHCKSQQDHTKPMCMHHYKGLMSNIVGGAAREINVLLQRFLAPWPATRNFGDILFAGWHHQEARSSLMTRCIYTQCSMPIYLRFGRSLTSSSVGDSPVCSILLSYDRRNDLENRSVFARYKNTGRYSKFNLQRATGHLFIAI